jgi:hypothetical protein
MRSLARGSLDRNATLTGLDLSRNNVGAEGARSLAAALDMNATLTSQNNIRLEGARSLAAGLDRDVTLTSLNLDDNKIGVQGARALAAAWTRTARCRTSLSTTATSLRGCLTQIETLASNSKTSAWKARGRSRRASTGT